MALQEIVGAIVDHSVITSDRTKIEAARMFGQHIRCITRREADRLALLYRTQEWLQLAVAGTLYLTDGMSVFRPHWGC